MLFHELGKEQVKSKPKAVLVYSRFGGIFLTHASDQQEMITQFGHSV